MAVSLPKIDLKDFIKGEILSNKTKNVRRWCENFKAYKEVSHGVTGRIALRLLEANVAEAQRPTLERIRTNWIVVEKKPAPTSDSDYDSFFDYVMKELPSFFRRHDVHVKLELHKMWHELKQGEQSVQDLANNIQDLTTRYAELDPPIVKSVQDQYDRFYLSLNKNIRTPLMAAKAQSEIRPGDSNELQNKKYGDFVDAALAIEGEQALLDADSQDDTSKRPSTGKSAKTASVTKGDSAQKKKSTWIPWEDTLCRNHASGRGCSIPNCKRQHIPALDYVQTENYSRLPQREKDLIQQIIKSGATPGNPAAQDKVARSKKATAAATTSSSSGEIADLRAELQSLGATVSTLVQTLQTTSRPEPSRPDPPVVTMDLERLASTSGVLACAPRSVAPVHSTSTVTFGEILARTAAARTGQPSSTTPSSTSNGAGTSTPAVSTSTTPTSTSDSSSGPPVVPVTELTPSAHIPVFLGPRGSVQMPMKLDACNEAPRSLMSKATYDQHLAPQGLQMQPVPVDDYPFSACNGLALTPIGCVRVPVYFRKPKAGDVPVFQVIVYIVASESGFEDNFLVCTRDLSALGMILNMKEGWVQFAVLKPSPRIKLSAKSAQPVSAPPSRPAVTRVHAISASASFGLERDKFIPSNVSAAKPMTIKAHVPNLDESYVFSPKDPDSPIRPGVIPANVSTVHLQADNPKSTSAHLSATLEVEMTASAQASVTDVQTEPIASRAAACTASIGSKRNPSAWHMCVWRVCAVAFLGLVGIASLVTPVPEVPTAPSTALVSSASETPHSLAEDAIPAPPPSCSTDDVDRLNQFFAVQRELVAADFPAYEQTPDPPTTVTSDSFYYGSIDDIQICPDLTDDQQSELKDLCREYQDIFIRPSRVLPQTDLVYHYIDTGTARPIKRPPRRYTPEEQEAERREIERMLEEGVIEPSSSPWACQPVMVPKPDGSTRYCINYVPLNKVTVKDAYPLPDQNEQLRALAGSRYKFALDAWSGYWQIQIAPDDRAKAAFVTHLGLYQPIALMFGLCNAPATYQRYMNDSFEKEITENVCSVYIDDISGGDADWTQFLAKLQRVFETCRRRHILLKPKKCKLGFDRLKHLGRIIEGTTRELDPSSVEAVTQFPEPRTKQEVHIFMGLTGWCRDHVPNFAAIAAPLFAMVTKDAPDRIDDLTSTQRDAFVRLKQLIASAPALHLPDLTRPFQIEVDASKDGFGCVLLQDVDGRLVPCGYYSRATNKHERRWAHPNKLEARAIVWAVDRLSQFLRAKPFVIRTDARNLLWLLDKDTGMYSRWVIKLSEYDFTIQHTAVPAADALSRAPAFRTAGTPASDGTVVSSTAAIASIDSVALMVVSERATVAAPVPVSLMTPEPPQFSLESIVKEQSNDPFCSVVSWALRRGSKADSVKNFVLDGNCLRYNYSDASGSYRPIVLPTRFQQQALREVHNSPITGHLGLRKTLAVIQRHFYWPRLHADAKQHVFTCHICQLAKKQLPNPRFGGLHPIPYHAPMHTISVDVVGPFSPVSTHGNRYIFVVVDNFTNFIWLFATPDETAATTAQILLSLFLVHGFPERLLTDRGSNFISDVVAELLRLLRVKAIMTSSYHPQTDGKNEISHRLLLSQVRSFISKSDSAEWDEYLPFFAFAANSSPIYNTTLTPFYLLHGRQPQTPNDIAFNSNLLQQFATTPSVDFKTIYARQIKSRLDEAHKFLIAYRKRQQASWIARRDAEALPVTFDVGDYVIVHTPTTIRGVSTKLLNQFTGPYKVVAQHQLADGSLAPNVYDLEHARTGRKLDCINITRLHRYRPGSDFLLEDYEPAAPALASPSLPTTTPQPIVDDFVVDDMVVVKHPTRSGDFAVGQVIHIDYEAEEITIHYWGTAAKNLHKATLKPEYYDPSDGKSLFTDRPLARHSATVSLFPIADVLTTPFALTKKKTLPAFILTELSKLGLVGLILAYSP